MRNRVIVAVAAVAAVVGLGVLAGAWFATPGGGTQTFAGTFTPETELGVRNLTIGGGHVRVGYSLDVLYEPEEPGTLRCGLVDTSGTLDFFEASRSNAPSGQWTHLEFESDFELPELTLGIRCSPSADGVMSVVVRDATLTVEQLD